MPLVLFVVCFDEADVLIGQVWGNVCEVVDLKPSILAFAHVGAGHNEREVESNVTAKTATRLDDSVSYLMCK